MSKLMKQLKNMKGFGEMNNNNFNMMKKKAEQLVGRAQQGGSIAHNIMPGVKPDDLFEIKCKNCGGEVFMPVHTIKFASRFQTRNGVPTLVQFPLGFACIGCDEINPFNQEEIIGAVEKPKEEKPADLGVSVGDGIATKEKIG